MRRIYIGIIFLLTAFSIAAVETGLISAKADYYISRIENIDKYMRKDDFQKASELCREVEGLWDDSTKTIDIFLIHDYVDSVSLYLTRMNAYIANGSIDMYFSESAGIKKELTSLKESELPTIDNIL